MVQVNVYDAKTQLSRLIDAALAGEQVTIARQGRPLVDLVRHEPHELVIGVPGWAGLDLPEGLFEPGPTAPATPGPEPSR